MRFAALATLVLLAVVLVGCAREAPHAAGPAPAAQPENPPPPPNDWRETARLWAGLGATPTWFGLAEDGRWVFDGRREQLADAIPAFVFETFPTNASWDMLAVPP